MEFTSGKNRLEINISNPVNKGNSFVMDAVMNMFKAEFGLLRDFLKFLILYQVCLDFIYMYSFPWHSAQSKP